MLGDLVGDRDVAEYRFGHGDKTEHGEVRHVEREHDTAPLARVRIAELDLDATGHGDPRATR